VQKSVSKLIYNNLANGVSILGVLPLCMLFLGDGSQYLIPLIIYNNVMDDLDGVLASKLNIKSEFGAILDNVCDAVSHIVFVMFIAIQFGGVLEAFGFVTIAVLIAGLVAASSVVLRIVSRLLPASATGTGSPTNELVRHLLLVVLLTRLYEFNQGPVLMTVLLFHAVSMLVPFRLPFLIRSLTKSATAIGLLNVALVVAWLIPVALPFITLCFVGSYLYSFASGYLEWLRNHQTEPVVQSSALEAQPAVLGSNSTGNSEEKQVQP